MEYYKKEMNNIGSLELSEMLKSRLKVRMVEMKMSQTTLAGILNVTKQTVNAWANEKLNPPLETALRIAKLLECSVDDLWEYEENV